MAYICKVVIAAEAMFSWPGLVDKKTRVDKCGQIIPTPSPTPNKGNSNSHVLWCSRLSACHGINTPKTAKLAAEIKGEIISSLFANCRLRPDIKIEPIVQPADIKAVMY